MNAPNQTMSFVPIFQSSLLHQGMLGRITLPDGQAMEAMVEGRALSAGLLAVRPAGEGEAAGPVPIGKRVTLVPRRQAPDALVGEFGQRGTEGLATLSAEIERLAQGGGGAGPTRALNTAAITPAKVNISHADVLLCYFPAYIPFMKHCCL